MKELVEKRCADEADAKKKKMLAMIKDDAIRCGAMQPSWGVRAGRARCRGRHVSSSMTPRVLDAHDTA
jgi:hypothetical protein